MKSKTILSLRKKMTPDLNTLFVQQPSVVPYWNLIKDTSTEIKETLLNMLYVSLKEEKNINKSENTTLLSGTWKDDRDTA